MSLSNKIRIMNKEATPPRRSTRKRRRTNDKKSISFVDENAFALGHNPEKGTGVFAFQTIDNGELVFRYRGELLDKNQASKKCELYDLRGDTMCYQFFFKHKGEMMCLDATEGTHISRFVNHSRKRANVIPKLMVNDEGTPFIAFKARCDIKAGEELLFDYGERDPEIVRDNLWLKE